MIDFPKPVPHVPKIVHVKALRDNVFIDPRCLAKGEVFPCPDFKAAELVELGHVMYVNAPTLVGQVADVAGRALGRPR